MGGGGGGKGGGEQTTKMELPGWLTPYAKEALAQGTKVAQMGYVPYIGPDVAAFNPQQISGMQQSADMASAFGFGPQQNVAASLPKSQKYAGGVEGYSSFPMFAQAQKALADKYPGLAEYLSKFTIDPKTGQMPGGSHWSGPGTSMGGEHGTGIRSGGGPVTSSRGATFYPQGTMPDWWSQGAGGRRYDSTGGK